jgi:hypothetical protein
MRRVVTLHLPVVSPAGAVQPLQPAGERHIAEPSRPTQDLPAAQNM